MSAEEHRPGSLADSLAGWTPPWERSREPDPAARDETPAGEQDPEPVDRTAPTTPDTDTTERPVATEQAAVAESVVEPVPAGPAAPPPEPSPVPVGPVPQPPPDAAEASGAVDPADAASTVEPEPVEEGIAPPDDEPAGPLPELDDPAVLRSALEAILMVVDEPVPEVMLAQVLERPTEVVVAGLRALAGDYTAQRRGFELRQAAGGWRLYTRDDFAPYVERFVLDGQQVRLTQAALETLSVVAYKQPVTRSRISAIRGVNCDGVIRTLLTRGLIEECGAEPDSGAHLYRTTTLFLERMGINSVDELPPLAPFLPDDLPEEI